MPAPASRSSSIMGAPRPPRHRTAPSNTGYFVTGGSMVEAQVPRYFFDVDDGRNERDEEGFECANHQAAVRCAKEALPAIAADEVPRDGERQVLTVLISDETGRAVYLGTLTFTGTWLLRERLAPS